jgi:hypothetical protein
MFIDTADNEHREGLGYDTANAQGASLTASVRTPVVIHCF